jgi:hypothetical protein
VDGEKIYTAQGLRVGLFNDGAMRKAGLT